MNNRLIIPFMWENRLVGYTARFAGTPPVKEIPKYYDERPQHYLYNTESINRKRKFIFIVEGPMDALAIDGVAVMHNTVSSPQANWIEQHRNGAEIIVVPDRDGKVGLADVAIERGWSVAFPNWSPDIKDANSAVDKYGYLLTIKSIIDSRVNGSLRIKLRIKQGISNT